MPYLYFFIYILHRIRLNIIKYCFRTHWEMKQRETMTNEQARERIAMDCSCHEHARKPQPEDEFHLPGKVTKIDSIMYSWHNLDNIRSKIRAKSMESSNAAYVHD